MPTTVVRLSGTTFLILEPGENLSIPLKFMLFRCRLIAVLLSGPLLISPPRGPREGSDFLEIRLLLFPAIPVILVPSLLLRAGLPVEVGIEVFLSLIELPIREDLPEPTRLLKMPACGSVLPRTLGVLVLIMLPIRELLLELIRFLELPAGDFCVLGTVVFLVLIKLPIREDLLVLTRLVELPTCCFVVLRTPGVLVLIILPIREDLPELIRLRELADVCFPAPEVTVVGFLLPIVMLEGLRVLEATPDRLVTGVLSVILPD